MSGPAKHKPVAQAFDPTDSSEMSKFSPQSRTRTDWIADLVARGLLATLKALPYGARVRSAGWLMRRVLGPLAGYNTRALNNLAYIWPDMSPQDAKQITAQVLDNSGRTLIENYSTPELLKKAEDWTPTGPGLAALEQARADGRAVLLITGHFGNYEAARAALTVRGYNIGGLYRPMNNGYFNDHYVSTMEAFGGPVFPRGRRGTAGFVRHLKAGGQAILLIDQYQGEGQELDFLGKPAPTALSAADIALKWDALLIPFYAKRNDDGLSFEITLEAPIEPSTPQTMTQALMDSLSDQVRAAPGQWFWVHRRWKPERQRNKRSTP
jgi:KDO2-lipid IV(A) lauroyltransferase